LFHPNFYLKKEEGQVEIEERLGRGKKGKREKRDRTRRKSEKFFVTEVDLFFVVSSTPPHTL